MASKKPRASTVGEDLFVTLAGGATAQPGASGRCLPQVKTSGHFFTIERVGVAPPGL